MSFATVRLFVGTTLGLRIASLRRERVFGAAAGLNRGVLLPLFFVLLGVEVDNLVSGIWVSFR